MFCGPGRVQMSALLLSAGVCTRFCQNWPGPAGSGPFRGFLEGQLRGRLTDTHPAAGVQQEAWFTDALKAAVLVDAQTVQTHVPDETLVLVCGHKQHPALRQHSALNPVICVSKTFNFHVGLLFLISAEKLHFISFCLFNEALKTQQNKHNLHVINNLMGFIWNRNSVILTTIKDQKPNFSLKKHKLMCAEIKYIKSSWVRHDLKVWSFTHLFISVFNEQNSTLVLQIKQFL